MDTDLGNELDLLRVGLEYELEKGLLLTVLLALPLLWVGLEKLKLDIYLYL